MQREERLRRIKRKRLLMLAAREKVPQATRAYVAEVEAAKKDGIEYKDVAAALGISPQALLQARQKVNGHVRGEPEVEGSA